MSKIEKITDMKEKTFCVLFNNSVQFSYHRRIRGQDFEILAKKDQIIVITGNSVYRYEFALNPINYEVSFYSDGTVGFDTHGLSIAGFIKKHPMIKVKLF